MRGGDRNFNLDISTTWPCVLYLPVVTLMIFFPILKNSEDIPVFQRNSQDALNITVVLCPRASRCPRWGFLFSEEKGKDNGGEICEGGAGRRAGHNLNIK